MRQRRILIIVFISALIVTYLIVTTCIDVYKENLPMTPQQLYEHSCENKDKNYTGRIKQAIYTTHVDKYSVFIFLDNGDHISVAFIKGNTIRSYGINRAGFDYVKLRSSDVEKVSSRFDPIFGDRIVWGIYDLNEIPNITVNGQNVQFEEMSFTIDDENFVKGFWYIVLDGKQDYSVAKASDQDLNCETDINK